MKNKAVDSGKHSLEKSILRALVLRETSRQRGT